MTVVEDAAATVAGLVVATYTSPTDQEGGTVTVAFTGGSNSAGYYELNTTTREVKLTAAGATFVNGGGTLPQISLTATDDGVPSASSTQTVTPTTTLANDAPVAQAATVSGAGLDVVSSIVADEDTAASDIAFKISTATFGTATGTTPTINLSYTASVQGGSVLQGSLLVTDGSLSSASAALYLGLGTAGNDDAAKGGASLVATGTSKAALYGFGGDDVLTGSNLSDVLSGGGGSDTITGGNGADIIALGPSDGVADTLVYGSASQTDNRGSAFFANGSTSNMDVITQAAIGDKLKVWDGFLASGTTISTSYLSQVTTNKVAIVQGALDGSGNFTAGTGGVNNNDYIVQWANGSKVISVVLKDFGTTSPTLVADAVNDTLTLATAAAAPDTNIVVFDLVNGVSSSHSSRTFSSSISYTIYVRVDSTTNVLNTTRQSAAASSATWGTWKGQDALSTDDKIILVGTGSPILGGSNNAEVSSFYIEDGYYDAFDPSFSYTWLTDWNNADGDTIVQLRGDSFLGRITSSGTKAVGIFEVSNKSIVNPNGELTDPPVGLTQIYLTAIPDGILQSQGLL